MNCLKVRDFGSSFPVRYIPKNSPKTQKLQTSSPPMEDLEDKNKHDGLDQNFEKVESSDGVKVLGGRYIPKKSIKTEKLQTSSQPMKDFEDEDKHTDSLDCGNVVGRSNIPNKSVKTEKSETSSAPMNDFEDNDKHNGSDHNVVRVESSNGGKVLGRSYIPKKPVKTELETSSLPMNGFEDKVKHDISDSNKLMVKNLDGRKNVVRNYAIGEKLNLNKLPSNNLIFNNGPEVEEEIDHKWGSNDYEYVEDAEEFVHDLQGKDASQNLAFQADKTKHDAEKMAIAFLATRAFTTVELRKKLLAKKCPLHVVNEVIADFQIRGLLHDCLYAETFSRSRFSSLSWGPRRIQQALLRKGVSEMDAEKALKLVFKDGESGEDQGSRLGLSKLSLDHLFVQASKQWLRGQVMPTDKRKSRIIQWLQYRGFNWGVINFVLKKLESEYPP